MQWNWNSRNFLLSTNITFHTLRNKNIFENIKCQAHHQQWNISIDFSNKKKNLQKKMCFRWQESDFFTFKKTDLSMTWICPVIEFLQIINVIFWFNDNDPSHMEGQPLLFNIMIGNFFKKKKNEILLKSSLKI